MFAAEARCSEEAKTSSDKTNEFKWKSFAEMERPQSFCNKYKYCNKLHYAAALLFCQLWLQHSVCAWAEPQLHLCIIDTEISLYSAWMSYFKKPF